MKRGDPMFHHSSCHTLDFLGERIRIEQNVFLETSCLCQIWS